MTRHSRSYKGGKNTRSRQRGGFIPKPLPAGQVVTEVTGLGKKLTDAANRWYLWSNQFDATADGKDKFQRDMQVINVPATPTLVAYDNIYSCTSSNSRAFAVATKPATYFTFKILPMDTGMANTYCPSAKYSTHLEDGPGSPPKAGPGSSKTPAPTLKGCFIGFPEKNNDGSNITIEGGQNSFGFLIKGDILTVGGLGPNASPDDKIKQRKYVAQGNNMKASTYLPDTKLVWDPSMVFNISLVGGNFLLHINDVLVDTIPNTVSSTVYPVFAPFEVPSGPQMITNVNYGTLKQSGGNMPDCKTMADVCNPTKVYTASSALAQTASSATAQSASSALAQAASSARQRSASSALAQTASSARERTASSAAAQMASSAVAQTASSALQVKLANMDPAKTLATALVSSVQAGQKINQTVAAAAPAQAPPVASAISTIQSVATKGGYRRLSRKVRRSKKRGSRTAK